MKNWDIPIVRTIKILRTRKKITQENLSLEAGIDRTYISMLERGQRSVTINTLQKITDVLEIGLVDFLIIAMDNSKQ